MALTLTVRVNESVEIGGIVITIVRDFYQESRRIVELDLSPTEPQFESRLGRKVYCFVGNEVVLNELVSVRINKKGCSDSFRISINAPKNQSIIRLGKTRNGGNSNNK
jgi:sRNA-binding carbon storage regulator CsrA